MSNYRKVGQTWPGKAVAKYFKMQVLREDTMLVCVNHSSVPKMLFMLLPSSIVM
jgi:hypothetical protein